MGSWPSLNLVMEFNCDNDEKCAEIVTKLFEDFDDQGVPEDEIEGRSHYMETPFYVNENEVFNLTMMSYGNSDEAYQVSVPEGYFGIYYGFSDSSIDIHDIEMMKDKMKEIGEKISENYGISYTFVITATYG